MLHCFAKESELTSEAEVMLQFLVSSLAFLVAVATAIVSYRLTRFFRGSIFQKPWKILLLIPLFMGGIALAELLDITILRVRALFALAASMYSSSRSTSSIKPRELFLKQSHGLEARAVKRELTEQGQL
jgi:hypothetical protein